MPEIELYEIQFAQFAPDGCGKLSRVAIRAHHNIRLTHWRLRGNIAGC